jgi:RHS repeat-associated protein
MHWHYDAFNRLVERAVGASVTRFYYDDQWRLIAEYDGNDALVRKYVYGPEVDEPVRLTDAANGNTKYYYHAAALGTVTEITDATGNLVERYRYDVYGEPTIFDSQSSILVGSGIGNRLLFQGRDRDPDTGLYNFRFRDYSPHFGRFVHIDLILETESLNLYTFVRNNPTCFVDPLGLKKCCRDFKSKWKSPPKIGRLPVLKFFFCWAAWHRCEINCGTTYGENDEGPNQDCLEVCLADCFAKYLACLGRAPIKTPPIKNPL